MILAERTQPLRPALSLEAGLVLREIHRHRTAVAARLGAAAEAIEELPEAGAPRVRLV